MVRHLTPDQKILGSSPGRVICEAGYEASRTSNSPRVAGGPRIETSFCYLFSFFFFQYGLLGKTWVAKGVLVAKPLGLGLPHLHNKLCTFPDWVAKRLGLPHLQNNVSLAGREYYYSPCVAPELLHFLFGTYL